MEERKVGSKYVDMMKVLGKLEDEDRGKLEKAYGFEIDQNSLHVACNISRRYFKGGRGGAEGEAALHKKAGELLQKACDTLQHEVYSYEVDSVQQQDEEMYEDRVERIHFDEEDYSLRRIRIELNEITKEKDLVHLLWIQRVNRELEFLLQKRRQFLDKWKPLIRLQRQHRYKGRDMEIHLLQLVHTGLTSCLALAEQGMLPAAIQEFRAVSEHLGSLEAHLLQGIHESFKNGLIVGPAHVAKVASPLTGVPASWLLRSVNPPLQGLVLRMINNHVGQFDAIVDITNALSKPRPAGRPVGSFLFLSSPGTGLRYLCEVLAEQLYDDKNMLIQLDMSEYTDPDSVSRLLGVPSRDGKNGVKGKLTNIVMKRPFSVVLLENFSVAHASVISVLVEILSSGKLADGWGRKVNFERTLIIMTLNVGMHVSMSRSKEGVKGSIKELFDRNPDDPKLGIFIGPILRQARMQFPPQLFELLDEIVVLDDLPYRQIKSIARLFLRDIASARVGRGLAVYPSEAALDSILLNAWPALRIENLNVESYFQENVTCWEAYRQLVGRKRDVKTWLDENLAPVLIEMCGKNDNSTVYIDALVGTQELSYRLENRDVLVEDEFYKLSGQSSAEIKNIYLKEKERVKKIYLLRKLHYEFTSAFTNAEDGRGFVSVAGIGRDLGSLVTSLISDVTGEDCTADHPEADCPQLAQSELVQELRYRERDTKRAKQGIEGIEGLRARLERRSVLQRGPVDIVADCLLSVIEAPMNLQCQPIVSLLILGLRTSGKVDLLKSLAEHFMTDDGVELLIQINLSDYTDADSLLRLMLALSRYSSIERCGSDGSECVRMRPYSILFFDQIEQAHISVFSALISVLDYGFLVDDRGRKVHFGDTIFIINSDIGNKQMISSLVGQGVGVADAAIKEEDTGLERRSFRSELLNRVEGIVLFDPFADDQLRRVAELSMKFGPHVQDIIFPYALPIAMVCLFKASDDPVVKRAPIVIKFSASYLSRGIYRGSGSSCPAVN